MAAPVTAAARYSIAIGSTSTDVLEVGLPVLGGPTREDLFPSATSSGRHGVLNLSQSGNWIIGGAVIAAGEDLKRETARLYQEIFAAVGDKHLARIWNYVPEINDAGADGSENYHSFCFGRSLAFERQFGIAFDNMLPAASAVGGPAGVLSVVFAACDAEPVRVENPLQIPAYNYPKDYGPRAPSFSRATVIDTKDGKHVFISGTAAIRGHATVAPDLTRDQIQCTLENLAEISKACGVGSNLGLTLKAERHFKVYIRHPEEHGEITCLLNQELFRPTDTVTYLQANICRSPLKVEIEATLSIR